MHQTAVSTETLDRIERHLVTSKDVIEELCKRHGIRRTMLIELFLQQLDEDANELRRIMRDD